MRKLYTIILLALAFVLAMPASAKTGDMTFYNGTLNIEMMGSELAKDKVARVSLTEQENGKYTFKLPNFVIAIGDSDVPCGDIVVSDVARTLNSETGDYTVTGSVNDLSLARGQIHAKVEIEGSETSAGKMTLTITVGWYTAYEDDGTDSETIPINVAFTGDKYPDTTVYSYTGKLNITMMGEAIATDKDATVYLQPVADGYYMFRLPDFVITIGDSDVPCGDIEVDNVTRTYVETAESYTIAGSTNDLGLAEDQIHAKVEVAGTETKAGVMNLNITVGWYTTYEDDGTDSETIPINVTFSGTHTSGVSNVIATADNVRAEAGQVVVEGYNGRIDVFTVDGRLVASQNVNGNAAIALAKGLYIVRAGKAVKVIVK